MDALFEFLHWFKGLDFVWMLGLFFVLLSTIALAAGIWCIVLALYSRFERMFDMALSSDFGDRSREHWDFVKKQIESKQWQQRRMEQRTEKMQPPTRERKRDPEYSWY